MSLTPHGLDRNSEQPLWGFCISVSWGLTCGLPSPELPCTHSSSSSLTMVTTGSSGLQDTARSPHGEGSTLSLTLGELKSVARSLPGSSSCLHRCRVVLVGLWEWELKIQWQALLPPLSPPRPGPPLLHPVLPCPQKAYC